MGNRFQDRFIVANPILIPPYRMDPAELKELKVQLKNLLDKGLFNQTYLHGSSGVVCEK